MPNTLKNWGTLLFARRVLRAIQSSDAEATKRLEAAVRFVIRAGEFLGGPPSLPLSDLGISAEERALAYIILGMSDPTDVRAEATKHRMMRFLGPWEATAPNTHTRRAVLRYHGAMRVDANIRLLAGGWILVLPRLALDGSVKHTEYPRATFDAREAKEEADRLLINSGWLLLE